jgi:hypothetical protein
VKDPDVVRHRLLRSQGFDFGAQCANDLGVCAGVVSGDEVFEAGEFKNS